MHAAEKRPIVDAAPRQHASEVVAKRELADPESHLVMTDRKSRVMIERQVAEMRMGVEAAQVRLAEVHQDRERLAQVSCVLEVVGL